MNPYAIPSLLAFVVNLSLGVYILSKDAKYLLNRIYALFASSMAIWAFGEFMWRCANNAEQAFLWDRIAGFGYCFTAPLLVNFMLIFSKKKGDSPKEDNPCGSVPTFLNISLPIMEDKFNSQRDDKGQMGLYIFGRNTELDMGSLVGNPYYPGVISMHSILS